MCSVTIVFSLVVRELLLGYMVAWAFLVITKFAL